MGLPFSHSMHQLYERVATPLQALLQSSAGDAATRHEQLWACYESGQMTGADLEREVAADPQFAAFVDARQTSRH